MWHAFVQSTSPLQLQRDAQCKVIIDRQEQLRKQVNLPAENVRKLRSYMLPEITRLTSGNLSYCRLRLSSRSWEIFWFQGWHCSIVDVRVNWANCSWASRRKWSRTAGCPMTSVSNSQMLPTGWWLGNLRLHIRLAREKVSAVWPDTKQLPAPECIVDCMQLHSYE